MDIEQVREYCLSFPLVTEDMAFGDDNLLFRVHGKIFVCMAIDGEDYIAMKCDPDYALELRDKFPGIKGAFHWNKKYWNQLNLKGDIGQELIKGLIRHSYSEVVKKLPKKIKNEYPEIMQIRE